MKSGLKAVELFAGIGGFRLGMDAAGIETIWANDIGELACRVYESNFGRGSIVLGDINQVDIADIPNSDLLAAGFPCQPFSAAGKKQGTRLGYTVFGINGVASTLTASTSRHYERYKIGSKFRRLTNIEYARLMGFPDNWCRVARVYDKYALFGNAVVPACVEWICRRIGQRNFSFENLGRRDWTRGSGHSHNEATSSTGLYHDF